MESRDVVLAALCLEHFRRGKRDPEQVAYTKERTRNVGTLEEPVWVSEVESYSEEVLCEVGGMFESAFMFAQIGDPKKKP